MLVLQGRLYAAGIDVPSFTPDALIKATLEKAGFDNVFLYEAGLEPDLPKTCARGSKPYQRVAIGRRAGPDAELELPGQVAWVCDASPSEHDLPDPPIPVDPDEPTPAVIPKAQRSDEPGVSTYLIVGGLAAIAGLLLWRASR